MSGVTSYQFQRAMPVLDVADMQRSLAFYRDMLGFHADTWEEPPTFAILQRGTVTLALALVDKPSVSRTWAAYIYVGDVEAVYAECADLAVIEPPGNRSYNCRDFTLDDPDGHMLAFGQVLAPDPLGQGLGSALGRDGGPEKSA